MIFDGERFDLSRVSGKDAVRLRQKTAFVFQSFVISPAKPSCLENLIFSCWSTEKVERNG